MNHSIKKAKPKAVDWLIGGGEMGRLLREMDWSQTPLGPVESWPQSLRTTVSLCLASNFPISIAWGPQRTQIYNDGYLAICGAKHPHSMGQDFKECWLSAWPAIGEAFERASAGETAFLANQRMFLDRNGYLEETFFTFSFSPIRDESGCVGGLFHPVTELTQQTLAERRLRALRDLDDRAAEAQTVAAACDLIAQTLAAHDLDIPFALLYLIGADCKLATLAGSAGLAAGSAASPKTIDLAAPPQPCRLWAKAARDRQVVQVDDLDRLFGQISCGPYPEPPQTAFAMPIVVSGLQHPIGLLVAGISSRRALDEAYRAFYIMLREAVTSALVNARAYEEERRRAEALRESEERFRMLADNISQLAWTCDLLGNVTWYNKRWLEYTGLTFEDMKGWGWSKVQHPDHVARVVARVKRSSETGEPWEDIFPLLGKDGGYRWFLSRAMPIRDEHGDFVQWFGTNTDITEQVLAEEQVARQAQELLALNERLRELDRLKNEFFSNVSHEFRTPLTLMLGPLEDTLAQPGGLPPEDRERLEVAHRNSLRLLKLVNTLLDFSRIEAGRIQASYELTDLATFTAELASVFRSAIERAGLRLVIDCAPLDEAVYVDREMWEKIVLNLLSNAFKFTFEGEIEVGLRIGTPGLRIDEAPKRRKRRGAKVEESAIPESKSAIQESAIRNPRCAILTVRDTGTGIPAEEIPRLFERFHRIKGARGRTFEGSGIGLALVQELVKLHGGTARVESEIDRGSVFTVSIPLGKAHLPSNRIGAARTLASTGLQGDAYVEEALLWLSEEDGATGRRGDGAKGAAERHEVEDKVSPRRPVAPSPRPRVLLADDNADMREYLRRLLGRRYEVEAVADGLAALRAARERAPDLVLADVMMPGMDGFGLLKELRADERLKTVPIILLSARAGEESRVEGMEAGADDYLIKPFSARELMARVESHVMMAQLRGRLIAEAEKEIAQRRQAEEALRESEKRFRLLLEKMPAVAYTCDAEGLITYYNPRAVEVWGREPKLNDYDERFCGSFKLYSSDGAPIRHDQCWMALAIKEDNEYNGREVEIERPDGSRVTGLAHINPIHDAAGKLLGAVNIVVDISDRKRAEAALIESEERFRHMADNAPALIWVTSPTECEFVNREYLEFLGVGEQDVLGDNWAKFVHPEDREDYVNAFLEAVSSRSRFESVFRFRRHDGEYRWMQSVGMPRFEGSEFKGYVGSSHDIHERKLTETAMAQMATIVESSHAAIISKDMNGIITSWNQGAERLFGYTAEEVIGKSVTILFPPDREDEELQILERLRRGERVDHYETVRRRKDGKEIDISLTISPIRDKTGKVVGASKIARDISERKRKEVEREELLLKESAARAEAEAAHAEAEAARAEAEAANRSKDEFLAVVSHELRSPLNSILGYNRMLRERHSDESQLKRSCEVIERNARTQLQLIEDLLDTARIGSGKLRLELRKLDIIPALVDALNIVRPTAEAKGVRLRIADCGLRIGGGESGIWSRESGNNFSDPTPHLQSAFVLGDAARLQQIVWNLLSNAIKFTPAGGSVELRAERAEEHIRIIVSDTGKGIQPEFMPHIFDRFQQRDSSSSQRTGGLGLGLALVKHLTELHGGKVEAMSEGAGRGSTFTVTLPLVAQSEMGAAEPPALSAILTGDEARTDGGIELPAGLTIAGVRVLVVDDQEDAREMIEEFLSLCGAVVTTASSGAEALAILSNPPGGALPDIMLCDISMPSEDGYTALRRVRALEEAQGVAASERIPAIALTALTGAKERLRSLSAGFRHHIAKPVDPVELALTIANALEMSRQEGTIH